MTETTLGTGWFFAIDYLLGMIPRMSKKLVIFTFIFFALLMLVFTSCGVVQVAKVTVSVVGEDGAPIEGASVYVFRDGYGGIAAKWTSHKGETHKGETDAEGKFSSTMNNYNGYVAYGAEKEGYYKSSHEYQLKRSDMATWSPWNPTLKVVLRKIVNPVPMYARNTKMSEIIIPAINENIGFDLIRFDWVNPYGAGESADFTVNLTSRIGSVRDYDFMAKISFKTPNGIIGFTEDPDKGSQFILPRYAPDSGYDESLTIFDRSAVGKGRMVSWEMDANYIFRTRAVLDKDGALANAMYGKIIGDIRLGPQKDGKALLIFKYYLNTDGTRNLEFDSKRNLFKNLPSLEQVGIK